MHAARIAVRRTCLVRPKPGPTRTWGRRSCKLVWLSAVLCSTALGDECPAPDVSDPDCPIEEVVIIGSHIWLNALEGSMPVTVLSRTDIERGGADSIGKVLQTLPAITGSQLNTNVNGSGERNKGGRTGDGSVRAVLRGGSVVLLNGRRFPNGGLGADSSVDLNMLPMSWIERVEVLTGGASAVYGADASGGVINIITRRGSGLEAAVSRSIAHGDGEIDTGQAAFWFESNGGGWGIGVDYAQQDGVTLDRRGYSAVPKQIVDEAGTLGYAGSIATPEGRFTVPAGNILGLEPGDYTRVTGATGQTAADYRPFTRTLDGFNPAPYVYSQTPNERAALWLQGSHRFDEHTQFFLEGLLHERSSEQQVAPEAIFAWFFMPELENGWQGIPADNYYNPFGVDLLPGEESGPATRRFVEAGEAAVSEDVDLWRMLVGLEGSVGAWEWQVSVAEARSDATTVEKGFFVRTRFFEALGPSGPDEAGHIVCGQPDPATGRVPAASVVPGCVPLNLFGGPGSITQDQIDHMSPGPLTNTGTNEQRIADLTLSGPWGRMFDRDVEWALGASYRREAGSYVEDPLTAEAIGRLVSHAAVEGGQYDTTELFAEVALPLLHNQPWADDVAVQFGARWSDFSYFDQNTSWQASLRWRFGAQVMLRASYAEVFRTPTIDELYGPRGESIEFAIDPCGSDPTPTQRVNCAANGVPGGAYVQGEPFILVISGGNPTLAPETGHTVATGLVYTPAWIEGLTASIDYSRVETYGFIAAVSLEDLLYGCAEHGSRQLCDAIRRLPNGSVSLALIMNGNLGWTGNSAFDIAIDWQTVAASGDLAATLQATYLDRWDEQPVPGWPAARYAGTNDVGALPRWRASGTVEWFSGLLSASYSAQYIGSYREWVYDFQPLGILFEPYRRLVHAVLYHDVAAGFGFRNGVSVQAAITNVFDQDPPFVNSGSLTNTDEATYQLLGRTYFLELRYALK